jgi:hypothetical protein
VTDAELAALVPPPHNSPRPPDDDTCRECYEWRRYPPGQEHFGWAWWRKCGRCDHEHHKNEVWLA